MSDNRLPIDDPRLTAYALGELEPAEAAELEKILDASPESRVAVDEIRDLAGLLAGELRQEQGPTLLPGQRAAILQAATGGAPNGLLNPGALNPMEAPRPKQHVAPAGTASGGFTTGTWGKRFASLMTIAAMIMVAFLLTPGQHPARVTARHDNFYSEFDVNNHGGMGGGGGGLAQHWGRPADRAEPDFDQFGMSAESLAQAQVGERFEDEVRLMEREGDDGTQPAPLSIVDNSRDQPTTFGASSPAAGGAGGGLGGNGPAYRRRMDVRAKQKSNGEYSNGQKWNDAPHGEPVSGPVNGPVSKASVASKSEAAGAVSDLDGDALDRASGKMGTNALREGAVTNSRGRGQPGSDLSSSRSPRGARPLAASDPAGAVEFKAAAAEPLSVDGVERSRNSVQGIVADKWMAESQQSKDKNGVPDKKESELSVAGKRGESLLRPALSKSDRQAAGDEAKLKAQAPELESKPGSSKPLPALSKKLAAPADSSPQDGYARESGQVDGKSARPAQKDSPAASSPQKPSRLTAARGRTENGMSRPASGAGKEAGDQTTDSQDNTFRFYAWAKSVKLFHEGLGEADAPETFNKSLADSKSLDTLTDERQLQEEARRKNVTAPAPAALSDSLGLVAGLNRKVTLNFQRAPLQEVVKQVAEQGEFRYTLDAEGLTQQGVSPQTPVTYNVESVPADVALQQLLTPLALNYAVSGEGVRITNRAQLFDREEVPGTEAYDPIVENPFVASLSAPLSTFSIDVDTASYANVRRFITQHQLPPRNAVRVEELVNYFAYDYPQPGENRPIAVNVDVGQAPWRPEHRLVRIGLKAREIPRDRRPASNLVFLVDVSGSMSSENKLPLVKRGLTLLTEQMTEGDRVAIVTYSDTAAVRLESTTGDKRQPILETINGLQAAGSTNGAGGIQLAYRTAIEHFIDGGTNRVILCTDGDFNVGVSDDDELVKLIQDRARSKVFFSVFGFGMGNLKDGKLEKLADKGNGHYAYIDGQREAQKVFVDELAATLVTVAKDVKLQVEFNPARVGAYRLIGYENRALATQDFHDDRKDAGEMGAGHTVTALYEIAPSDRFPAPPAGEALRYQRIGLAQAGEVGKELMAVRVRYKLPEADESALFEVPVIDPLPLATNDESAPKEEPAPSTPRPPRDFDWAAAVAAYGMVLRDSQYRGQAGLDMVLELAQGAKGEDPTGRRQEFIDLVQQTKSIRPSLATSGVPSPTIEAAVTLTPQQAEERATVNGKYRNLLRIIPADGDSTHYGAFHDFGKWEGTSYLGHDNLPRGYWVYVAPNWYLWGDAETEGVIKK